MKTVVFPKRTEYVGDADDGAWMVMEQVKVAVEQSKGQAVIISLAPREVAGGQTCYSVIARPVPRLGEEVRLTLGEIVFSIFPPETAAELVANTEHSCPRGRKANADCSCRGLLTLRRREAGH